MSRQGFIFNVRTLLVLAPVSGLLALSLSGCGEAATSNLPEYAGVRGCPTISAVRATFDDDPAGTCLTLHGARVMLSTDPDEARDLSAFRSKVVLVLRSPKKATFLAAMADAVLSTGGFGGQKPTPYEMQPSEYGLVSIAADGQLSSLDTQSIECLQLLKASN